MARVRKRRKVVVTGEANQGATEEESLGSLQTRAKTRVRRVSTGHLAHVRKRWFHAISGASEARRGIGAPQSGTSLHYKLITISRFFIMKLIV